MIARAFGYRNDLTAAQLVQHLDRMDGKINRGTRLRDMIAALDEMRLSHRRRGGFDRGFLSRQLHSERLVVLLGRHRGARHGHYLLVTKKLGQAPRYLVNDPWPLPGRPRAQRRMTAGALRAFVQRGAGAMIAVGAP
jgi:hypothetical protein